MYVVQWIKIQFFVYCNLLEQENVLIKFDPTEIKQSF